jgi:hypothetical protein
MTYGAFTFVICDFWQQIISTLRYLRNALGTNFSLRRSSSDASSSLALKLSIEEPDLERSLDFRTKPMEYMFIDFSNHRHQSLCFYKRLWILSHPYNAANFP